MEKMVLNIWTSGEFDLIYHKHLKNEYQDKSSSSDVSALVFQMHLTAFLAAFVWCFYVSLRDISSCIVDMFALCVDTVEFIVIVSIVSVLV